MLSSVTAAKVTNRAFAVADEAREALLTTASGILTVPPSNESAGAAISCPRPDFSSLVPG